MRDQVFISYSHKDVKWKEMLLTFLKPHTRNQPLDVWDDTRIKAGDKWRDEIRKALARARAGVLLVTPHFLASDFIDKEELPPLLEAAQNEGLRILWIAVSHSGYEETPIAGYQALNTPSRPLSTLKKADRDKELVRICKQIALAGKPDTEGSTPTARPLTRRELEVLRLLAEDLSYADVARELRVATSTVKTHLLNIFSKLEAHNRTQAVERARERKLI